MGRRIREGVFGLLFSRGYKHVTCFFLHLDLLFGFLLNMGNAMGLGGSIWIGGIRSCRLIFFSLWILELVNEKMFLL